MFLVISENSLLCDNRFLEDFMVSTATKIGAFDFDNCLMNAAGINYMNQEKLA